LVTLTQDRPTAAELVRAVREFLEGDVMAATEGRVQFHTRVAVNALGMIERELTVGPGLVAAERERAAAILGPDISGHEDDARELEIALAAAIRNGSLDDRLDAVRDHVRATVREKLLVANPGYLPPDPSA
jgi:erythromycin esterase-like protein